MMRYAMLIYADQSAWADLTEERAAELRAEAMPRWISLFETLGRVDPELTGTELDDAATAKTVRVRGGETVITDGPFAETREQIGGIFAITCANLDTAIELAAQIPTAEHGSVEVRPIVQH